MAEKKTKRYVIVPRTNEGYKELYAKAGQLTVVFGQPYDLTEDQLNSLNNQKEAVKNMAPQTPYDIARERGVSIDKAIEMMESMGNTTAPDEISWLPRYDIHEV